MAKLTLDEKDQLEDLIRSNGLAPVWKEADECLQLLFKSVLNFNLDASNKDQFFIIKAQADGAAKLLVALKQRLDKSKLLNK